MRRICPVALVSLTPRHAGLVARTQRSSCLLVVALGNLAHFNGIVENEVHELIEALCLISVVRCWLNVMEPTRILPSMRIPSCSYSQTLTVEFYYRVSRARAKSFPLPCAPAIRDSAQLWQPLPDQRQSLSRLKACHCLAVGDGSLMHSQTRPTTVDCLVFGLPPLEPHRIAHAHGVKCCHASIGRTYGLQELENHVTARRIVSVSSGAAAGQSKTALPAGWLPTWEEAKRGVRRHHDQSFWAIVCIVS